MRTTVHRTALAALLAALLALAACGGGGDAAGGEGSAPDTDAMTGGGDVTVVAKEFVFEPDDLTLPAGTISLTVDNQGVIEHDFVVDELGIHVHADAGQQATAEVTLEPGTYDFYCSIPGHRASGMEGTLTVD